MLIFP
jgi:DNA replication licensing factor MCM6